MQEAPEKIYGWLDTQLSIARFYGGCKYSGHQYVIDMDDPQRPLVRLDVMQAADKERKAKAKKAEKPLQTGDLWKD